MRLLGLVIPALAVAGLATLPHASAAPEMCGGEVATITVDGEADSPDIVTGTEGDDVISTTGPVEVVALGGNDIVCVESGYVLAGDGRDRVLVTGSDRPDYMEIREAEDLDVRMGGGADSLVLFDTTLGGGTVDGGKGRNDLLVATTHDVLVNLAERHLESDLGTYVLTGFVDVQASAQRVKIRGDARPNALSGITSSCKIRINGLEGDDDLRVHANGREIPYAEPCAARISQLVGGPGDDYLRGGKSWADTLTGGAGRDTADGRTTSSGPGHIDTCYAEVRRRCER